MNCPVCKNPMIVLELEQIEVDYCTGCEGIWLDAGELELLIDNVEEQRKLLSTFQVDKNNKEKPLRCPKCLRKMDKVFVGEHDKVLVDNCKKGHGIWFDKNELFEILVLGGLSDNSKVLNLLKSMFAFKIKDINLK
jgi:Zn-finger nucleic acid-binding protein